MKQDKITITSLDQIYELLKDSNIHISDEYLYSHPKKTDNKLIKLSLGRIWFNLILPDRYNKLINEPVTKKLITKISNEIYETFSPEEAAKSLSFILKEAFKMASINPVTFEIDSLIVPTEIKDEKNRELTKDTLPEDFGKKLSQLSSKLLDNHLQDTGISDIIKSGAKGSPIELGVLSLAKGPTLDIEGNISEPITSSLMDGYSGKEYYTAASEARRTYFIRAIGTAEPGALAREVIFANSNTALSSDDCGTNKYLELFVKDKIFNTLMGRYYLNERTNKLVEITKESTKIINTIIKLRSPLYCKDPKGICKTCYGKLCSRLNTRLIGLISGSVINAAGIEGYAMKARHQATQVNLKQVDFTQDLIQI